MFLDRRNRLFALLLLGILALAALLRLGALRAEFWFDEIWSWEFARAAGSPWRVFAGAGQHHDNNHKLNTMLLALYPADAGWWWYRLHSLLAGLAGVAAAALLAARRGRIEALFAALLFASDYWLVVCSTEARGYALAVLFALLALYALQIYLERQSRAALVLFWLSAILGFCAHLTFLHCYLALGLWTVYHGARRRLPPRAEIGQLLACHLVPALFVLALYFVDIRHMALGGAPPQPMTLVLGRLFSLGLGGPAAPAWFVPLIAGAIVLALGLRLLARDASQVWLFFAVVIVGSPALFLLGKPAYLFERYFLISFAFFLLLLSYVLGAMWRQSRTGAALAALVLLVILAGSIRQIADFERGGRGRFLEALAYIERESAGEEISVAGDYDFRVRKFYTFYIPYLNSPKAIHYREQEALPPGGTDWLLVHRLDDRHPPEQRMMDTDENVYERVQDFPVAAFGGWSWYVYRNAKIGERGVLTPCCEKTGC